MGFKKFILLEKVISVSTDNIVDVLEKNKKNIQKYKEVSSLIDYLNKLLKPFKIRFFKVQNVKKESLSYALLNKKLNLIELPYNENDILFLVNKNNWEEFIYIIKKLVSHELVHLEQLKRSKGKAMPSDPKELKTYLSNPHDIMAFAREIYFDFRNAGLSNEEIINYLKNFGKAEFDVSSEAFMQYINNFPAGHKVRNKLFSQIISYAESKEI